MGLKAMPARIDTLANRLGFGDSENREAKRRQLQPWRNWYKLKRWFALRDRVFKRDLMICQQTGVLLTTRPNQPHSAIADHIIPHNGDPVLFWDEDNVQSVSKQWHDSVKQSQERSGNAY